MAEFNFETTAQDFSMQNAYWLGRAAQLAYKSGDEVKAEVENWGLGQFEFYDVMDSQAFMAGNDDMLILAFRGTESMQDAMTDIDIDLVGGPVGKVHEGFSTAVNYIWREIWKFIRNDRNDRPLWVTGHSLGAAMAALAVARLRLNKDIPVNGLYTFGQPRTGDEEFAKAFNADFESRTFRFVNNNDVVTRVPFRVLNYKHIGTFKYFDADGDLRKEMSWWEKLVDRIEGRFEDILEPGTDGMNDHSMVNYVECLEKAIA